MLTASRAVRPGRCSSWMLALLALLFLVAGGLTAQGGGGSPESLSALRAAAYRASQGDWAGAKGLVDAVLDLDARDSDALYLSALVGLKLKDEVGPSLAALGLARSSGGFRIYSAQAARDLEGNLLLRLGRFEDLLSLLPGSPSSQSSADVLDPEFRRLRALAYLGLGRQAEALVELRAASERFPEDPAFARIFFKAFAAGTPSDSARSLAQVFLSRLAKLSAIDPDLQILALPYILDPLGRRNAILARRAMGGFPNSASLAALQYGVIGDMLAIAEVLEDSPTLDMADLLALYGLLGSAEGRKELASRLAHFTMSLSRDENNDSWPEEAMVYKNGVLQSWSLDADQDGSAEARMDFSYGLPSDLSLDLMGQTASLHYGDYPSVLSLSLEDRAPTQAELAGRPGRQEASRVPAREVYTFFPGAIIYAPLSLRPFPSTTEASLFFPQRTPSPAITSRAATAVALSLRQTKAKDGMVLSLNGGIPLRRETFLEGRLVASLDYKAGQPLVENVDSDLDGRFETERAYRPDTLAGPEDILWTRVDADGNGIYEYLEDQASGLKKSWDFDQDGLMDAIEEALAGSQIRRQFSSRLDGRFDEVLVLDSHGKLQAFTRDSKSLVLVQDANPRLRWLGKKPFDLGSNLPGMEGIYTRMGIRYRLVYAGDSAFAEVIE